MSKNILVAYASKYGATKEIAERIGTVLSGNGEQVEVLPAETVKGLGNFQAVILGSAIYVGKWPKEAGKFLKNHEKALAQRPFWVFSSGPSGEGEPIALVEGKRVPSDLQKAVDRIRPRDVTVFHGNIDAEKLNPIEKWAVKSVVKKPFGDYRDWHAIENWADQIAMAVK